MHKIKVISKKYDGALRDEAEAFLVAQDDETIVLLQPPGTVEYVHRKQRWETMQDGLILLFFTNRWYNVWHIAEQHSNINHIYANIAMPARWLGNMVGDTLEWVDLDLDIRVHLDGSIALLDEDEFAEHQHQMGYPPVMVTAAERAAQEALHLCRAGRYPFDHSAQVARYATALRELGLHQA